MKAKVRSPETNCMLLIQYFIVQCHSNYIQSKKNRNQRERERERERKKQTKGERQRE
jgi:hypothetical protein